ncbi:C2H2-type zinc finger protein [Saccharolobus islandicus]|uniref:C2H2-type zinc finger protein n=1 Tax=Saccharolobus islandicus TaxID=43080 RepID=UPI000373D7B5|nr:C2H2-type zinc finger protein [Sulfolobus islandicus]
MPFIKSHNFLSLNEVGIIGPYVCPLCLMPFSSSVSLKQHIRYTEHAKTCPICKKEFTNTDSTLDHVCKKHNICVS